MSDYPFNCALEREWARLLGDMFPSAADDLPPMDAARSCWSAPCTRHVVEPAETTSSLPSPLMELSDFLCESKLRLEAERDRGREREWEWDAEEVRREGWRESEGEVKCTFSEPSLSERDSSGTSALPAIVSASAWSPSDQSVATEQPSVTKNPLRLLSVSSTDTTPTVRGTAPSFHAASLSLPLHHTTAALPGRAPQRLTKLLMSHFLRAFP